MEDLIIGSRVYVVLGSPDLRLLGVLRQALHRGADRWRDHLVARVATWLGALLYSRNTRAR